MADVETVERFIPVPPERIFDLLADPRKHREIDGSGTVRDARGEPEQLKLGSTFGMSMKVGIPYGMNSKVIEYEENRPIAWQPRPAYPVVGRLFGGRIWRYELEPVDGGTRVRESWDISQERRKLLVRAYGPKKRKNMTKTPARIEKLLASR